MSNKRQTKIDTETLYLRGWSVASAARRIKRSRQHVLAVLKGQRTSPYVTAELAALPQRPFTPRERVTR